MSFSAAPRGSLRQEQLATPWISKLPHCGAEVVMSLFPENYEVP
jgi:hypothetical protein